MGIKQGNRGQSDTMCRSSAMMKGNKLKLKVGFKSGLLIDNV